VVVDRELFEQRDRTILMVSHRLAFASSAAQVVVLGDNGRVLEQGSPTSLAARQGVFAALYEAAVEELMPAR
jgi:ABC-type multidrug transport system fused ATPase/permease subunit